MAAIVAAERMLRNHGPVTPDDEKLLALAEGCRRRNSEARIKPVLQAFGVVNAEAAPV
jgi:guanylate kinase